MSRKPILLLGVTLSMITLSVTGCIQINIDNTSPIDDNTTWNPAYGVNYTVTIIKIIDGDTVNAVFPSGTTEKIRLLGVDSPETTTELNQKYEYGNITDLECLTTYGVKAKHFTENWLNDEEISIQFDSSAGFQDIYGRWLAYVYTSNGTDFNAALIKKGFARVYDQEDFTKKTEYLLLQKNAQNQKLGLWNCENNLK